ncbi:hypothetical protein [Chromobacterium sphagni]|uniref:hypothetical protein n=1 Tax=Chromobacterium sphagni TaxID=1903179 RepID=UPI001301192A|nr:hypothetical protein [Chromobacterium sphagni]
MMAARPAWPPLLHLITGFRPANARRACHRDNTDPVHAYGIFERNANFIRLINDK